jgi:FKBP-type peptidyl-prolyl cis-trans isomerase FkpA
MSNYIKFLLLAGTVGLFSCNKDVEQRDCNPLTIVADSAETVALQDYLNSKAISATKDPRGFFYIIAQQGDTGKRPSVCSTVKTSYTGRLTNGQQFSASNSYQSPLNGLILGWQEGLPLIGKGGSITLFIPPSLAYGAVAKDNVPANSILTFSIELLDVL